MTDEATDDSVGAIATRINNDLRTELIMRQLTDHHAHAIARAAITLDAATRALLAVDAKDRSPVALDLRDRANQAEIALADAVEAARGTL